MLSLSSRQSFILNRVVDTFIETGCPVSSRVVAGASPLPVSSATVRHEMGALEDTGYLVQAHHSSGRIPTDRGYRHYLDHGIKPDVLCGGSVPKLSAHFSRHLKAADDQSFFIDESASVLSELSQQMGVLLVSDAAGSEWKEGHFQMTAKGLRYLLDKPECRDASTLRPLVRAVEEKKTLQRWISSHAPEERPHAFVGLEHEFEDLEDYAIVTARFRSGEQGPAGVVAVIGLKRMAYARVLPIVSEMAHLLGETLHTMRQGE